MSETTFDVRAALRSRYPAPAWAFFEELRNGTGFTRVTRTADAMAFGLYPSRGLELHGFEVKISRSDWLREKNNPEKAEELSAYCDRWWLVVSDPKIVRLREGELPPSWGLLVPRGKALVAAIEAPKREAKPLTRQFMAAVFRRLHEQRVDPRLVEEASAAEIKRIEDLHKAENDRRIQALTSKVLSLEATITRFREQSGVDINDRWDRRDIGAAVHFVLDGGLKHIERRMEHLRDEARDIARHAEQALKHAPADEAKAVSDVA